MKTTTFLQMTAMSLVAIGLMGCGGGLQQELLIKKKAVKLIADYAASNANAKPGVNDYSKAGVDGVIAENVDAVNAMIDKGVRSDYDSESEIQDIVDKIGRDKTAVLDKMFGDGVHDFIYGVVTNPTTGKTWLNNNLGARYADANDANFDPQQQATSPKDFLAYGSLFQWGRRADGHELINRTGPYASTPKHGSTTVKSNTPAHSLFIKSSGDWRVNPSATLWAGVASVNNVCPDGYRLPWWSDMSSERASWSAPYSMNEAFASTLKWNYAGYRHQTAAVTIAIGVSGYYWLANTFGVKSYFAYISSGGSSISNKQFRSWGFAVRCIKN